VAAAAATLRAGADAATARALTPTLTPLPSATPVPTGTPAPTWTSTPDATVAALVVEAAAADRDTAVLRAWIVTGMLAVLGLGILVAVLYGIGLMWASWESRMADAKRKQHIPAGPYYDMATGQVVGLLPEPERPAAQPPAQDESIAYTAEWQRGYWTFARWLEVLPPADRTRAAMSGIVSNHGWNVYMAGLREMSGVLTKDGKVYRLVAAPDEVRRACVAVIPPFDRASPTLAPAVRPVDAAYRRTVATPTEAAEAV